MSSEKMEMKPLKTAEARQSVKMDFDDILQMIGPFGRYQKLVIFLVLLPALLPDGILVLNSVFMAATPADHWCKLPVPNHTDHDWHDFADLLPKEMRDGHERHSRCLMFDVDYRNLTDVDIRRIKNRTVPEVACSYGFEFDQSVYEDTIVTEWELVCGRDLQATASFTYFTLGGMFGPMLWGLLADRFGRRFGFYACVVFQSVFSVATAFAPSYVWFSAFRFLVGMTTSATYALPLLLAIELTGPKTRAMVSVLCSTSYTLGVIGLWAIAYFVRTWRTLSLVTSVPLAAIFIFLFPFFPESPRWLLSQGQYEKLEVLLRRMARINQRELDPEFSGDLPDILMDINRGVDMEKKNSHSILEAFKMPNMRKKTIILVIVNFCNKGVFMGLNYYAPGFGVDPHWNFLLANIIELPPYIFAEYLCDRIGRRGSLFLGMFVGAIACLASVALPSSSMMMVLVFSLFGKFCITFTYLVGELMEEEMFPTVIRGEGQSLTSVVSAVAGCITPFVVHLGHDYVVLPLLVFGGCCLLAAFLALFLPETANQDLPQSMEDGESFGKNMTWKEILHLGIPPSNRDLLNAAKKEKGHLMTVVTTCAKSDIKSEKKNSF
ncbi:Carcinine [Hypsibius exemplaris]|uniref:Carcinine n=1 Tax=Hypsibius exemplaris TaxID=2072580 RepID=A0A1W0WHH3_HYPEX|nr:Carcinine [Hypsibius exemplaris]